MWRGEETDRQMGRHRSGDRRIKRYTEIERERERGKDRQRDEDMEGRMDRTR